MNIKTLPTVMSLRDFYVNRANDKQVINLKPVLLIRFLCGFYCDFIVSTRFQWVAKLYSTFLAILFPCAAFCSFHSNIRELIVHSPILLGYIAGVLMEINSKEKFFVENFRYIPTLDGAMTSKQQCCMLKKYLIVIYTTIFGFRIFSLILFFATHSRLFERTLHVVLNVGFLVFITFVMDIGRLPVNYSLALLLCRTKVFRSCLSSCGFGNKPQTRLTAKKYLQMYSILLDGVKKIEIPTKIMISVYMTSTMPKFLTELYTWLSTLKEESNALADIVYILQPFQTVLSAIIPAVMLDALSTEVDQIKILVVERLIACKNERDRSDVKQLYHLIHSQPLDYVIWRLVPLSLHTVFSFIAFCVTIVIAILQAKIILK